MLAHGPVTLGYRLLEALPSMSRVVPVMYPAGSEQGMGSRTTLDDSERTRPHLRSVISESAASINEIAPSNSCS